MPDARPAARPPPAATTAAVPVRASQRRASRVRATRVRPSPCRSTPLVREPVTDAEYRQQVAWIVRIRLHLAAQVLDVGVDGALVRLERDPANGTQQLSAAEDPPRLPRHGRQQLELGRRQLDSAPGDRQLHAGHVELDVAGTNQIGGLTGGLAPAQHRANTGDELLGTEGFRQVVVRAQLETNQLV